MRVLKSCRTGVNCTCEMQKRSSRILLTGWILQELHCQITYETSMQLLELKQHVIMSLKHPKYFLGQWNGYCDHDTLLHGFYVAGSDSHNVVNWV